jgi:zinc D-Ala-D-Ala dipeptidase
MMRAAAFLSLLLFACTHQPVSIPLNHHGLPVIDTVALYHETVAHDPARRLVDLSTLTPPVILDIRYATADNFMKRPLYPEARALLRAPAAEAVSRIAAELQQYGLGLKVFDAYRPYHVTEAMWEQIGDPDYVADPARGSRHNRGAAVDVTLVELATGRELVMPTGYDSFEPAAHHDYQELPEEAKRNRAFLRWIMEKHGFEALPSEWWHYDFGGWQRFELMDLPLGSGLSDRL